MPIPSVTFRSELPAVVRKELDQLDSELTGYLLQEHDDDGHHTHINAQSIKINGVPVTPAGAPALHAPSHSAGAADPVTVTNLAGYPGNTTTFLRGDKTFQPIPSTSPTPHALSHAAAGADPVEIKTLAGYPGVTTSFLRGDGTFQPVGPQLPQAHHLSHEPGGADPLSNVGWTNLSNTFVPNQRINGQLSVNTVAADLWMSAPSGYFERNRAVPLGEWQAYTPTWVTGGAAPSLGNGSLTGAYALVGKTMFVRISFTTGSTTNCGTGPMVFGFPFPPGSQLCFGSAWMYAHTGIVYTAVAINGNFLVGPVGVALVMNNPAGNAGLFQQGGPITLTNPDYVFMQATAELA